MGCAFVVPIGDVNRSVRPRFTIDRSKADIVGLKHCSAKARCVAGAVGPQIRPVNGIVQCVGENVGAIKSLWKRTALITYAARGNVLFPIAAVWHMAEIAISMRIM